MIFDEFSDAEENCEQETEDLFKGCLHILEICTDSLVQRTDLFVETIRQHRSLDLEKFVAGSLSKQIINSSVSSLTLTKFCTTT